MKKIKILILLFVLSFMTGCGYDDVYKEYKDVLDSLDCSYVSTKYGENDAYPKENYTISFSASSSGFYINLNGSEYPFYDKDGKHTVSFGDYSLSASESTLKEFLEKYKNNGNSCPTQIFMKVLLETPNSIELASSCSTGDGVTGACFLYTTKSTSVTSSLVKSNVYTLNSAVLNKEVQIQFGYNTSTKKSYLYMDNVEYEFEDNYLWTPIQNYNKYLKIDASDYDGIFKIEGSSVTFPTKIYLGREVGTSEVLAITTDPDKYDLYDNGDDDNNSNNDNGDDDDNGNNKNPTEKPNYDVKDTSIGELCSNSKYRKIMKFFGTIVNFARILVPIVIILFGVIDLYKAVTGAKEDEIKKSFRSILVRVIAGILVFLLPGLVQFFFNMLNEWSDYKIDVCCCTECLLNKDCNVNSCSSDSCKIEGTNE